MSEDFELVAEQIRHLIDLKDTEIKALKADVEHYHEFTNHRLEGLEKIADDHEQRLRDARDGITQFKTWAGLASGGSGIMALIALLKAFFNV